MQAGERTHHTYQHCTVATIIIQSSTTTRPPSGSSCTAGFLSMSLLSLYHHILALRLSLSQVSLTASASDSLLLAALKSLSISSGLLPHPSICPTARDIWPPPPSDTLCVMEGPITLQHV
ncbi:hypothetical protein Tco_1254680 [Tanacetum coccineum]